MATTQDKVGWRGPSTLIEGHPVRWGEPASDRFIVAVAVHSALALLLLVASFTPLVSVRVQRVHKLGGMSVLLLYPLTWAMGVCCCIVRITNDGWAPAQADGFTTPVMLTFVWLGFVGSLGNLEAFLIRAAPAWGWERRRLAPRLVALNVAQLLQAAVIFAFGLFIAALPEARPKQWGCPFVLVMLGYPFAFGALGCFNMIFWASADAGWPAPQPLRAHHLRNGLAAASIVWLVAVGHALNYLGWNGAAGSRAIQCAHFALNWVVPLQLAAALSVCASPQQSAAAKAKSALAATLLSEE